MNNNPFTTQTQPWWANLSLRVKLILVLLAVTLLSVGAIAFLNVRSTSAAITERVSEGLFAIAETQAHNLGTVLAQRVSSMQTWNQVPEVLTELAAQNAAYSDDETAIQSELAKLDQQWTAAGDDDALIQARLDNELARELREYVRNVPDIAEAFLTDRYGGLVAAADRTSDYYQADEGWWQAAYNDGQGGVFIAEPELDESAGVIGIDMAVPIYASNSNEVIGVLRTTLDATTLLSQFDIIALGDTGELELVFPSGATFGLAGPETVSHDLLAQLDAAPHGHIEAAYEEVPSLIAGAQVSTAKGETFITNLDWLVIIHQDSSEALVAVRQETRNTGLLALLIAGLAIVAAVVMGRALTNPIVNLTNAVTRFTAGDMDARARSKSSDEIGTLAASFNLMAEQVGSLLADIQERSAELAARTREIEASQRVTFAASERADPDRLLQMVVNLIRDQFHLYHVQVYVVDDEKQTVVLRQSTGYAGRRLLQKGHQIPLDATALVTRAIRTGEPVLVADVSQDENFLPNPLLPDTRSELVVPLKVGNSVVGVLDAQAREPGRFTENTIALFQTMTDQIAFLFENSELVERVTDQGADLTAFADQLRAASDIARRTSTILDPDRMLQQAVELIQSRFGLYHVHVYVLDEGTGDLVVRAGSGEVGRVLRERGHSIPLDAEKSLVAHAARDREIVLVDDTSLESDFMPNPLLPQTRSEMAAPLVAGDRVLGVLDVQDDQAGRFAEAELDTFSTLAGQIAAALQNAAYVEEIQQAAEQLREMDRLKSEFMANMSHELRTPLNSIIGYAELMLMGVSEIDPDTLEDVQAIYDNGRNLLSMINDILDMAKIEAGSMTLNLEKVQIAPLIDEASAQAAERLESKPIAWSAEIEPDLPPIQADPLRIGQILNNLVTNAEKFTAEGAISLRAWAEDSWVCLEIKDTGIGIAASDMDKVFDRFQQVDSSSTRRAGGAGLGLAITRHLVELHGGTIEVESQPGEGSTFTVRLPVKADK